MKGTMSAQRPFKIKRRFRKEQKRIVFRPHDDSLRGGGRGAAPAAPVKGWDPQLKTKNIPSNWADQFSLL